MRYLLIVALISIKSLYAQTITGKIICKDDKQAAAFATILIDGKGFGTATDENGKFKLTIPQQYQNEQLTISFLGYTKKKININTLKAGQANLIYMIKDVASLTQFNVVAKKELTPKQILKKVLKNIKNNYAQDTIHFDDKTKQSFFVKFSIKLIDSFPFNTFLGEGGFLYKYEMDG